MDWETYDWPNWLPTGARQTIMDFWPHDGPAGWLENIQRYHHPPLGARVECRRIGCSHPIIRGRWIPVWRKVGRVLLDDGRIECSTLLGIRRLDENNAQASILDDIGRQGK